MRGLRAILSVFCLCACVCESAFGEENKVSFNNTITPANTTANRSIDELHALGVEAYLEERWDDCVDYLENALAKFRTLRQLIVNCRLGCRAQTGETSHLFNEDVEDFHFYETLIHRTLCLINCKKQHFKNKTVPCSLLIEKLYTSLKPYEYLQLCYYKKEMFQKAASAVFTYLVANPDHDIMAGNLKFYTALPDVNEKEIENLEVKSFVHLYVHGVDAYEKGDYDTSIKFMEESLREWLTAAEECRAYCEAPFDQGWLPDFTSSVANHFTFCLRCKNKCDESLNSLNGEYHDDLLPSHYHFLQFAYYKVGDLEKACAAAESYLVFYPEDEIMLKNKKFYLKELNDESTYFVPRKEAVKYLKRKRYEESLLDFIDNEFDSKENHIEDKGDNNEVTGRNTTKYKDTRDLMESKEIKLFPPPIVKFSWPTYGSKIKKTQNTLQIPTAPGRQKAKDNDIQLNKKYSKEWIALKKRAVEQILKTSKLNIKVIMGEKELKGKNRVLADGFAQESECQRLIEIAQIAAIQGDGYIGNKSPHSDYEKFEGVSLGRAAMLVYFGLIDPSDLELYLNVSENGRDYVERYFNLQKRLYFTFTHLVCRTALASSPANRVDMSHAVHADNCNLLQSGMCPKEPPAYIWRDFSAILYLNENFDGGEFIFADDVNAKLIQIKIEPKCGRLVGFSAGRENLHGVLGVRRGRRCAIGLWFTFNSTYNEVERVLAEQVLREVRQKGTISEQLIRELGRHIPIDTSRANSGK